MSDLNAARAGLQDALRWAFQAASAPMPCVSAVGDAVLDALDVYLDARAAVPSEDAQMAPMAVVLELRRGLHDMQTQRNEALLECERLKATHVDTVLDNLRSMMSGFPGGALYDRVRLVIEARDAALGRVKKLEEALSMIRDSALPPRAFSSFGQEASERLRERQNACASIKDVADTALKETVKVGA